jgi:hypothetical protein
LSIKTTTKLRLTASIKAVGQEASEVTLRHDQTIPVHAATTTIIIAEATPDFSGASNNPATIARAEVIDAHLAIAEIESGAWEIRTEGRRGQPNGIARSPT